MSGVGVGETQQIDLDNIPYAGQEAEHERRMSAAVQQKYGLAGPGQSQEMDATWLKLKPYLDFFGNHPILTIAIVLAIAGAIMGVYTMVKDGAEDMLDPDEDEEGEEELVEEDEEDEDEA